LDTSTLLGNLKEGGQKLVEELAQRGFEMTAAFWILRSDNEKWYFYIVSPLVDTEGAGEAYMRLGPLARAMPQPYSIDPLRIRLIGQNNPLAKDVLAAYHRSPALKVGPIRWRGRVLGDVGVEDTYFYSLPVPTA
jgi:hypothetical protein